MYDLAEGDNDNHLYSVAALSDLMGAVVERYQYDSYGKQKITDASGNVTRAKSAVGWDRGFTGYVAYKETGYLFARNRIYSPALGQFVNRDPVGYHDGHSLYRGYFVPNRLDPWGLFTFTETDPVTDNEIPYKTPPAPVPPGYSKWFKLSGNAGEVVVQKVEMVLTINCDEPKGLVLKWEERYWEYFKIGSDGKYMLQTKNGPAPALDRRWVDAASIPKTAATNAQLIGKDPKTCCCTKVGAITFTHSFEAYNGTVSGQQNSINSGNGSEFGYLATGPNGEKSELKVTWCDGTNTTVPNPRAGSGKVDSFDQKTKVGWQGTPTPIGVK